MRTVEVYGTRKPIKPRIVGLADDIVSLVIDNEVPGSYTESFREVTSAGC
jgi:hypothetical protein